jgi:hypothetical protein
VSDETHHGAESPPMGAEYDTAAGDEGFAPLDRAPVPGHAREDCPYPAGCSGCLQDIRPPAPDVSDTPEPHHFENDPEAGPMARWRCRHCGKSRGEHADGWRGEGHEVWPLAPAPRQDPIADIGATERPPARRLAQFRCGACDLTFRADDDTTVCPRCSVDGRLVEILVGATLEDVVEASEVLELSPPGGLLVTGGPMMAELREASTEAILEPLRAKVDDLWAELSRNLVDLLHVGRTAVEQWRQAPTAEAPMAFYAAMHDLAQALGMQPGPDGRVPRPNGPHVELLQETAEMMRAEAAIVSLHPDLRLQGAARRLQEHADLITRTVGVDPT